MSWIAPALSAAPAGGRVTGGSATGTSLGCGPGGEDLGHPMPLPLHPDQPEAELGHTVADQVVRRLVTDVDVEDPALAPDRDPGLPEPRGERGQVPVDLDGHDRPSRGHRRGA